MRRRLLRKTVKRLRRLGWTLALPRKAEAARFDRRTK